MTVIREGDVVRVLEPTFVWRVGYPKRIQDYLPEAREACSADLDELLGRYSATQGVLKVRERIEWELAWLHGNRDGWGGDRRSLHTVTIPDWEGSHLYVDKVVTRQTGVYGHACNIGVDEPEWVGPGLIRDGTHRLALVSEAYQAQEGHWYRGNALFHSPDYVGPDRGGFRMLKEHGKEYQLSIDVKRVELVQR